MQARKLFKAELVQQSQQTHGVSATQVQEQFNLPFVSDIVNSYSHGSYSQPAPIMMHSNANMVQMNQVQMIPDYISASRRLVPTKDTDKLGVTKAAMRRILRDARNLKSRINHSHYRQLGMYNRLRDLEQQRDDAYNFFERTVGVYLRKASYIPNFDQTLYRQLVNMMYHREVVFYYTNHKQFSYFTIHTRYEDEGILFDLEIVATRTALPYGNRPHGNVCFIIDNMMFTEEVQQHIVDELYNKRGDINPWDLLNYHINTSQWHQRIISTFRSSELYMTLNQRIDVVSTQNNNGCNLIPIANDTDRFTSQVVYGNAPQHISLDIYPNDSHDVAYQKSQLRQQIGYTNKSINTQLMMLANSLDTNAHAVSFIHSEQENWQVEEHFNVNDDDSDVDDEDEIIKQKSIRATQVIRGCTKKVQPIKKLNALNQVRKSITKHDVFKSARLAKKMNQLLDMNFIESHGDTHLATDTIQGMTTISNNMLYPNVYKMYKDGGWTNATSGTLMYDDIVPDLANTLTNNHITPICHDTMWTNQVPVQETIYIPFENLRFAYSRGFNQSQKGIFVERECLQLGNFNGNIIITRKDKPYGKLVGNQVIRFTQYQLDAMMNNVDISETNCHDIDTTEICNSFSNMNINLSQMFSTNENLDSDKFVPWTPEEADEFSRNLVLATQDRKHYKIKRNGAKFMSHQEMFTIIAYSYVKRIRDSESLRHVISKYSNTDIEDVTNEYMSKFTPNELYLLIKYWDNRAETAFELVQKPIVVGEFTYTGISSEPYTANDEDSDADNDTKQYVYHDNNVTALVIRNDNNSNTYYPLWVKPMDECPSQQASENMELVYPSLTDISDISEWHSSFSDHTCWEKNKWSFTNCFMTYNRLYTHERFTVIENPELHELSLVRPLSSNKINKRLHSWSQFYSLSHGELMSSYSKSFDQVLQYCNQHNIEPMEMYGNSTEDILTQSSDLTLEEFQEEYENNYHTVRESRKHMHPALLHMAQLHPHITDEDTLLDTDQLGNSLKYQTVAQMLTGNTVMTGNDLLNIYEIMNSNKVRDFNSYHLRIYALNRIMQNDQ